MSFKEGKNFFNAYFG